MSILDEILKRLKKYPDLSYRATEDSITVDAPSPTGFSVALVVGRSAVFGGSGFTVLFDGWHEEFGSEEDAFNCFAFGLSDACRLKIYRRCRLEYRWAVEYRDGDDWKEDSVTGLLVFPFWCRREIVYRQNGVIRMSDEVADGARPTWRKEPGE